MPNATFIVNNESDKIYSCGICSDNIENDKIISLGCNPTKHIFCYDCISDWFKQIKNKKYVSSTNYGISNMCPICLTYGGLLPLYKDDFFVKGINYISKPKKILPPKVVLDPCGAKLKTKDGFCQAIGRFNGKCGKHKIVECIVDPTESIDPTQSIDPKQSIDLKQSIDPKQSIEVI